MAALRELDSFTTPVRRPTSDSTPVNTPGAPMKERSTFLEKHNIDPARIALEVRLLQLQISREAWLYKDKVKPLKTIHEKLREFQKTYRTASFKTDDPIKDDKIFQVVEMTPENLQNKICELRCQAADDDNQFPIPSRAEGSQYFSTYLDSWVLLAGKKFKRSFGDEENMTKKDKITFDLLALIFKLSLLKKNMKLREIYYTNNLYKTSDEVGEAVDDICCMIGCPRKSLGVSAAEKGVVFGDISFSVGKRKYKGRSDPRGIIIPSGNIRNIDSKRALFILVVEKDTVLERLVKDRFTEKYRCIIITAKGMPDVITRAFLSLIRRELKLPVFALMDCNPYGLKIYSVYRYGSKTMSYDRENLTTPGIELLGIRYSDIDKYQIPEAKFEKMTVGDYATVNELLKLDYMKEYHADLKSMRDDNRKIQIEAFQAVDVEYFAEVALPLMLDEKLSQLQDDYILKCEI